MTDEHGQPPTRRQMIQASAVSLRRRSFLPAFDTWSAELVRVLAELERVPEADEARRDQLLDRWQALEQLILHTRGSGASAARAKSDLLWRLFAMERHENTGAMSDVRQFVFRHSPW